MCSEGKDQGQKMDPRAVLRDSPPKDCVKVFAGAFHCPSAPSTWHTAKRTGL